VGDDEADVGADLRAMLNFGFIQIVAGDLFTFESEFEGTGGKRVGKVEVDCTVDKFGRVEKEFSELNENTVAIGRVIHERDIIYLMKSFRKFFYWSIGCIEK
jgi:hypothetical protein